MTDGITAALVAFQTNLPRVDKKSSANVRSDKGSFRYDYADLADVAAVVLPALAAVGVAYTASLRARNGGFVLVARLRHVSGETIKCEWPVQAGPAQQMGSAITYGRRYCLLAMSGVHPAGEDDDGAAAAHRQLAAETVDTGGRKATRSKTAKPAAGEDDPWAVPVADAPDTTPATGADDVSSGPTRPQFTAMNTIMGESLGIKSLAQRRTLIEAIIGRPIDSSKDMSRAEASAVIDTLHDIANQPDPHGAAAALLPAPDITADDV